MKKILFLLGMLMAATGVCKAQQTSDTPALYGKDDLLRKGFRFYDHLAGVAQVDGVEGKCLMQCFVGAESSDDPTAYTPEKTNKSWYQYGHNVKMRLNGLAVVYVDGDKRVCPNYCVTYMVDGYPVYPMLTVHNADDHIAVGINEGTTLCYENCSLWAQPLHRPMFAELKKIYGDIIDSREFMVNGAQGRFDHKALQEAFDRFMASDMVISPEVWSDPPTEAQRRAAEAAIAAKGTAGSQTPGFSGGRPAAADGDLSATATVSSTTTVTSGPRQFPPVMNQSYKYHIRARGGDYGMFETDGIIDFWEDETVSGSPIACREYAKCVYENGRIYEDETIYYGHIRSSDEIVFTHSMDSLNGGAVEAISPQVMTVSADGKTLKFHDWVYKR